LVLEDPIVGKFQMETEDEVVEPAITNCPSDFGRGGLACQCTVDSLDARQDKNSGFGWKKL
jgi:hypothetical protein